MKKLALIVVILLGSLAVCAQSRYEKMAEGAAKAFNDTHKGSLESLNNSIKADIQKLKFGIMKKGFFNGLTWVELQPCDVIEDTYFIWGDLVYLVGDTIERLGRNKRTSFYLEGVTLMYCGQIDGDILLRTSDTEEGCNLYLTLSIVNECTLLLQTGENHFMDIRY